MIMLILYLADIVNNLSVMFLVTSVISGIFFCISLIWFIFNKPSLVATNTTEFDKESIKMCKSVLKISSIVFSIFTLAALIIPHKNTIYLMAGAYYGEKAIKSQAVNTRLEKVLTIIDSKLDSMVKESVKGMK